MRAVALPVEDRRSDEKVGRHLAFYSIFFLGGMPALIYQVVWQRVLTLYFGVDIYSTTVTVATFMLGLGVGALCGGWLADRAGRPALYYAALEIVMGCFGLVSLALFAGVGAWFAGGSLAVVIAIDFLLLLVPTTLMGMTMPLMCRVVIGHDDVIGRHLSWLYGVNTLGAALGALVSSYLLIGLYGLDGTTRIAAALNIGLAVAVYLMVSGPSRMPAAAAAIETPPAEGRRRSSPARTALDYRWVLVFSFVSGFTALGYEIVWYRVLGILLHGTVYVFGTILFFYLAGIAAGSLAARKRVDEGRCIERFALCQLGIAAYAFVLFTLLGRFSSLPPLRELTGASFFTTFHPSPELVAGHVDVFALYSLFDIGLWAVLILGVPTVLMGYGFTNLLREGTQHVERIGHAIGGVYFANIAGSAIGSLAIGFLVLHYFGTEGALRLLIVLGSAVPVVLFAARGRSAWSLQRHSWAQARWLYAAGALALLAVAVFPARADVIRALHFADQQGVEFIGAEDRTGVSVLRRQREVIAFGQEAAVLGQQRLYIDGSHHGDGSEAVGEDWPVQVALAAHRAPRRVLLIGLGDGQMAATAEQWADVGELVIVELNGTLRQILSHTGQGRAVLDSDKVRYIVDDGRRWLLAHPDERFDLIIMFPLHAAHAFSGALYSLEFFELLAGRLRDAGILLVRTVDMFSTAKTIATVFPHVLRFDGSVYLAGTAPIRLNPARLPFPAANALRHADADRDVILAHTLDVRINRDFRPNSEYYITYPFAAVLQTRFASAIAYEAADAERFRTLILDPHPDVE